MVLDVLGQTYLIRWIGIGPYLLASLVFWMHCNACEQLNVFTGCIILSSKMLIIFCNKIGVSQRILFTAQKCSSYHMVKYLKKCSIYFLFQKNKCSRYAEHFCFGKWLCLPCHFSDISRSSKKTWSLLSRQISVLTDND